MSPIDRDSPGFDAGALLSRLSAAELERSVDLAPVSNATVQAIELERTGCADPLQLVEVLHTDPVIVAQVMRLVNSAALGLRAEVTTLERAGLQLGVKRLAEIALTAAMAQRHTARGFLEPSQALYLWQRSLAVALCARDDAEARADVDPGWAYMVGLFEGLGLLWFAQRLPQRFLVRVGQLVAMGTQLELAERRVLTSSHALRGAQLLDAWGLPSIYGDALRLLDGSAERGVPLPLARCLRLAQGLAPRLLQQIGANPGPLAWTESARVFEPVSTQRIERLTDELSSELRAA
ncbi:MAG: HDOD domain-containing protein [Planctomycetota bacterium]|jgi:HD-like signal output (HDOD) protein